MTRRQADRWLTQWASGVDSYAFNMPTPRSIPHGMATDYGPSVRAALEQPLTTGTHR